MVKKKLCGDEAAACGSKKTAATRVFESARQLFYQRGIRAVGVDEIVAQAGVTKPSLYRSFASKDDLVAACLTESAKDSSLELEAILADSPCPEKQLRSVLRYFAAKIAQPDFRGCPMSNTAVEIPEPGHPGRAVLEGCKSDLRARLVGVARQLPIAEPERLADGILLVVEGAMASHHIFGSQGPSAAMVATGDALISSHLERAHH